MLGSGVALWKNWDPWPQKYVWKPRDSNARFSRAAFSPDSSTLTVREFSYSATTNSNFYVMDLQSGTQTGVYEGLPSTGIHGPTFSPDGRLVLIAYDDVCKARIWNTRDASLRCELTGSPDRIWTVQFSPDGSRVLTNNPLNTLQDWDTRTGALLHEYPDPKSMHEACYSPDGTRILHRLEDSKFEVLDAATFRSIFICSHHQRYIPMVKYSFDGKRILTTSKDLTSCVFDADDGRLLATLPREQEYTQSCAFSPDGRWITTSSFDDLTIYDANTYKLAFTHRAHFRTHIANTHFTRDGKWLMIRGFDGNQHKGTVEDYVKVYRLGNWTEQYFLSLGHPVDFAEYAPDESRIYVGSDHAVSVFDARTFDLLHTVKFETKQRYPRLQLSPDCQWLLTFSTEGESLTLWHNRRPEWWWGIAWLPAFWAGVVFLALLIWSIRSDRRTFRQKKKPVL